MVEITSLEKDDLVTIIGEQAIKIRMLEEELKAVTRQYSILSNEHVELQEKQETERARNEFSTGK